MLYLILVFFFLYSQFIHDSYFLNMFYISLLLLGLIVTTLLCPFLSILKLQHCPLCLQSSPPLTLYTAAGVTFPNNKSYHITLPKNPWMSSRVLQDKAQTFNLAKTAPCGLPPHHALAWVPATPSLPTAPSFLLILGSMQVLHYIVLLCAAVPFSCVDPSTWNAIPPSPHQTPAHVSSWSSQGLHFKSLSSWPHHLPSTSVMFLMFLLECN